MPILGYSKGIYRFILISVLYVNKAIGYLSASTSSGVNGICLPSRRAPVSVMR